MLAVYVEEPNANDPVSTIKIGQRPVREVPAGWVRVKMTHASLNRHDFFTMQGHTGQPSPIKYPMILGNDGAGVLDDGTEVILYPVMGNPDWRGDETLDPEWHIFGEIEPGTFSEYVVVPKRNAIVRPRGISASDASVLGTAWLTAYRMLFTKSNLKSGQTMLVQGAKGGMSTALIQMGRAAGFQVWVTSRTKAGRVLAEKLGAHRTFEAGEKIPRKVQVVFDNVGPGTFGHTMDSVERGGTIVTVGVTTGLEVKLNLLSLFVNQIKISGTIMGTLNEMKQMIEFVIAADIKPEIGQVAPITKIKEAALAMWDGRTQGKTVFTI
jgi:NADPH:quinone reductase-like Zn-dependent oxidoreductase